MKKGDQSNSGLDFVIVLSAFLPASVISEDQKVPAIPCHCLPGRNVFSTVLRELFACKKDLYSILRRKKLMKTLRPMANDRSSVARAQIKEVLIF